MKRFVEGEDRQQAELLPACLDDYVTEDNPVRVIDVFIDELDLEALGFAGVVPEASSGQFDRHIYRHVGYGRYLWQNFSCFRP